MAVQVRNDELVDLLLPDFFNRNDNVVVGNPSDPYVWIRRSDAGYTAVSQSMAGLQLTANAMNTTSQYTPAIKFGSTDPQFTTTNPKFMAMIVGRAEQTYDDDSDSGMALHFFTTPNDAGTAPTPTLRMAIHQDGLVRIGDGTDAPDAGQTSLIVTNAGNTAAVVRNSSSDLEVQIRADTSTGGIGTTSNHDFVFRTNATVRGRIAAGGNWAIGNDSPQALLHVGAGTDAPSSAGATLYVSQAGATSMAIRNSTDDVEVNLSVGSNRANIGVPTSHDIAFVMAGTVRARVETGGNFVVGSGVSATTGSGGVLDVAGNTIRIRTSRTPASSGAAGNTGEICWDSGFIYVYTGSAWERVAIATW